MAVRSAQLFSWKHTLSRVFSRWAVPFCLALIIVISGSVHFLLLHALTELFAIIVAITMFVVAWASFPFTRNSYLMYLGIGYVWMAGLLLFHFLFYEEIRIFPPQGGNITHQLRIAANYMGAFVLLTAPLFLKRRLNRAAAMAAMGLLAVGVFYLILSGRFPDAFVEGRVPTPFKTYSRFLTIGLYAAALLVMRKQAAQFDPHVFRPIQLAIVFGALAGLSPSNHSHLYGFWDIASHVFKLLSFWMFFEATVRVALIDPMRLMARGASTFDAVRAATAVVDRDGWIRQANTAACRWSGLAREHLIGLHCHHIFHPDPLPQEECPVCAEIARGRGSPSIQVHDEKAERWLDYSLSPIATEEMPMGMVHVVRDITDRMEREEEARRRANLLKLHNQTLMSLSKNRALIQGDFDTFIREVSERACRVLQVERTSVWLIADDPSMLSCADLYERTSAAHSGGEDLFRSDIPSYFAAMEQEERVISVDDVHADPRCQDLVPLYCRPLGISSMLDAPVRVEGQTIGVLCNEHVGPRREWTADEQNFAASLADLVAISMEAYERKRAEEKVRQSQALLIRAEKLSALGTLTAGITHEILNPATIIGLYAHRMMDRNPEGTDAHKVGQILQRNVQRISRICDDLRRYSRDEKPQYGPFDPNEVIRQTLHPLEPELRVQGIRLDLEVGDEGFPIYGDQHQISQVLFNIAKNAMEAMADGGVPQGDSLEVTSRKITEGGISWWEFRFRDNGPGIPAAVLPKVFDPFFTTKPEDKGTGLGLSISLGIVEAHGGRIWVESEPGRGTLFTIRLPLRQRREDERLAPADRG